MSKDDDSGRKSADKTDMAEERTRWSEDRTALSNERTFAGWMRTGMAALAVAIGLRAVFSAAEPTWVPKSIATIFIVAALVIFWTARYNAGKAHDRLSTHEAEAQSARVFTLLTVTFSIGSVATGVVLWTL
ncbi:DUF202 domain-containing protein [Jannaschia rubra]|uniref:DUF202 domain-containing protein n=1 Tax=Jannaschia rubra TaxID=282197 RepID=UPI0024928A90|nr:DUF202 domain-containing protein [Jannaschia rubra]